MTNKSARNTLRGERWRKPGRAPVKGPVKPVAVIDIGSNSGRVVVYRPDDTGRLRILASARAALRLVSDVDETRRLSGAAIGRAMEALGDFQAIALGAGASRIKAVATAAIREAANGPRFVARVRKQLGLTIELIDGAQEARYGFLGALHGLPVENGLLFDLGGGSIQISRFHDRKLERVMSLPLGALRVSETFLATDPPEEEEILRLRKNVRRVLKRAGVLGLRRGEELVGTGGTIRNLAKIDARSRAYPMSRVQGYLLLRNRIRDIAALLASRGLDKRKRVPGLSDERADSIVGGALVVETLVEVVGAEAVRVSGQGVREGVAYDLLSEALPPPAVVKRTSIRSLTSRFDGWSADMAGRRATLARALLGAFFREARTEIQEALADAATVLDIGRSIDFFDRYEHAADILMATELDGFSHREIALLAAIVQNARNEHAGVAPYRPLLKREDGPVVARAAVLLALADAIEQRCGRGAPVDVRCRVQGKKAFVSVPALAGWRPRSIGLRFENAFRRTLVVRPGRIAP